jgi:hypothetical protein
LRDRHRCASRLVNSTGWRRSSTSSPGRGGSATDSCSPSSTPSRASAAATKPPRRTSHRPLSRPALLRAPASAVQPSVPPCLCGNP